jgi:hypothetical protein
MYPVIIYSEIFLGRRRVVGFMSRRKSSRCFFVGTGPVIDHIPAAGIDVGKKLQVTQ